jgi:O-antigen ligase
MDDHSRRIVVRSTHRAGGEGGDGAPPAHRRIPALAHGLLIAAIAWGAFAFGAVYPWAYWPLAIVAAVVGVAGLSLPGSSPGRVDSSVLALVLLAFLIAVGVQLIPLPQSAVTALSPSAHEIVSQLDPRIRIGISNTHPLSIAPAKTVAGLAVVASLTCLLLGATRLLPITGVRRMASAIAIIGVVLAFAGIIQQPLFNGKIYGFWEPVTAGMPYGPFVNKNHFAGWMLMGLPLTLGLLCSRIARGMRGVRSGFREKLLWLASPDASGIALLTGAAALMGVSLLLTMSRSGIGSAALAITGVGVLAARRQDTLAKKISNLALVGLVPLLAVAWIGTSALSERFASANWAELNDRRGAWQDAIAIASRYPVAGTGFNTYGVATLFYQQYDLEQHYAQAHNDYLQLAAEGGLLLGIPAAACIVALAVAIRRRFAQEVSTTAYWIRAGAVTGICAMALQETVEFSLQMPGNAFLFVVLCAIALHRTPERRQTRDRLSEVRI